MNVIMPLARIKPNSKARSTPLKSFSLVLFFPMQCYLLRQLSSGFLRSQGASKIPYRTLSTPPMTSRPHAITQAISILSDHTNHLPRRRINTHDLVVALFFLRITKQPLQPPCNQMRVQQCVSTLATANVLVISGMGLAETQIVTKAP